MSPAACCPPLLSQSRTPPSTGSSWSSGKPLGDQGRGSHVVSALHTQLTQPAPHPTRVADLQAEVVSLRGHKACCERTTLSLLQELLQVHTCLQLQDLELKRLQQAAQAPEKEAFQVGCISWEATSPGVRAAVSWTLSPTQPLLLRPGTHSVGPCVSAGRAGRAPGLHSAHPSTLQFPSLQNQNQTQALDKRYSCTLGAGLTGGRGALGKQRLLPGQSGHQPLAFVASNLVSCSGKQTHPRPSSRRSGCWSLAACGAWERGRRLAAGPLG